MLVSNKIIMKMCVCGILVVNFSNKIIFVLFLFKEIIVKVYISIMDFVCFIEM